MASEDTWRKMPRNILTDPNFDYICSSLPAQYAAAPYMFYYTALSIADGDGIFDLEDGVIFSRLMHIGSPEVVMQIANLMLKRHIISRFGKTTKCLLTNWEYSNKVTPRTMEERRKAVERKIQQQQASISIEFTQDQMQTETDDCFDVDFNSTAAPDEDFFCDLNDKNQKNVAINIYDDKNAENVVKKNQTEKIREIDKTREIEHTQNRDREIEKPALTACPVGASSAGEEENKQEYTDYTDYEQEEYPAGEPVDLADQALNEQTGGNRQSETRLFRTFTDFFTKNCLGFNENQYHELLNELCRRMEKLADGKNPAEIIAINLLGQFKKLSEDSEYYKGIPLTPEELVRPGVYKHALAAVSRILCSQKSTPAWIQQLEDVDKAEVCNDMDSQYLKYNIDPQNPNRVALLMQAQAAERKGAAGP